MSTAPIAGGLAAGLAVLVTAAAVRLGLGGLQRAGAARRVAALGPGGETAVARHQRGVPRRVPARVHRWLAAALPEAEPQRAWHAWLVFSAAATAAGVATGGPVLGTVALVGTVGASGVGLILGRHRADASYEARLPAALDAVARSLRSGGSLLQAVGEAAAAVPGAVGADLARIERAARRGIPIVAALEDWAARRPLPTVRLASAALCLGAELGGAQARAVEGIAATVRDRLAVAAELRALSTQARASAVVLVAAPIAFAAVAIVTDGRTAAFLRTPLGAAVLVAGLALDAAGALWMGAIVRGAAR